MKPDMTPYKGIIRISCNRKCDKKLMQPEAGCLNCVHGTVEILDLKGNVLEKFNRPVIEETTNPPRDVLKAKAAKHERTKTRKEIL